MNTSRLLFTMGFAAASAVTAVPAPAQGYPWRDHAPPYDFLFGNEFDTHQQTRLEASGALSGFLYVWYTGSVTTDGYPVAHHANCNSNMVDACRVGWMLRGVPRTATFLYHVMPDHPTWLMRRADIPQPGAPSHFHFTGPHPTVTGELREGYMLELQAVDRFCFVHHEPGADAGTCEDIGGVPVSAGIDIATHLNVVASFLAN